MLDKNSTVTYYSRLFRAVRWQKQSQSDGAVKLVSHYLISARCISSLFGCEQINCVSEDAWTHVQVNYQHRGGARWLDWRSSCEMSPTFDCGELNLNVGEGPFANFRRRWNSTWILVRLPPFHRLSTLVANRQAKITSTSDSGKEEPP
jgi:hypothetical protein